MVLIANGIIVNDADREWQQVSLTASEVEATRRLMARSDSHDVDNSVVGDREQCDGSLPEPTPQVGSAAGSQDERKQTPSDEKFNFYLPQVFGGCDPAYKSDGLLV